MEMERWLLCPICNKKTRLKVLENTNIDNFPLFCPKCMQETIINVKQMNMTVIKAPDAQPITNEKLVVVGSFL